MVRTATENSYIYLNIYKRAAIRTNPHAWPQARVGFNLLLPLLQLLLFISRWKIFPFQNWIHLLRMEETSIGFGFVLHDLIALMHAKLFLLYSSKKKKKTFILSSEELSNLLSKSNLLNLFSQRKRINDVRLIIQNLFLIMKTVDS